MKLKIILVIIAILQITAIYTRKSKTSLKNTNKGQPKITPLQNQAMKHSYKAATAQAIIAQAFIMLSANENDTNKKIEQCLTELFGNNQDFSKPKRKLWYKLTQQLVENEVIITPEWLKKFSSIEDCGEKVLTNSILSNEKLNLKKGGINGVSDELRGIIKKKLLESQGAIKKKMKKFITSAASTYRNDKIVNQKNMFHALNHSKKRRRSNKRRL